MAPTRYAALVLLGCLAHSCDANSVIQIEGKGNMIRTEHTLKSHSALETSVSGFPKWEKYFKNLTKLTFVQIGANNGNSGDQIHSYATKNHWQGYAIQPNADKFEDLKVKYQMATGVVPLQLVVSDKDDVVVEDKASSNAGDIVQTGSIASTSQASSVTLPTLWEKHVTGKFPAVDILAIDAQGSEAKLLSSKISDPKPRFILFKYNLLGRHEYRTTGTNLEENGYKYIGRDGEDELHELIAAAQE